ncbi:MAG: Fis family transcriptional regulator [Campylobacterota bacterium]|nr:Fis family transcriptional regulator [Campylobacterota bacterium]
MAAPVVDVTNFITASSASKQVFKTATLLKNLTINALICGEIGVGKKSLAQYILPDAPVMDASDLNELLVTLESSKEIIITNLENSPNLKTLIDSLQTKNIRVIATAKSSFINDYIDEFFTLNFNIPPLDERKEDIEPLIDKFLEEASFLFGKEKTFNFKKLNLNLSENAVSLRRQVMITYLLQNIKDRELMDIMQNYLHDKLGSNSDYRDFLYLYEAPLINAGLDRFKSQLQLSDKLGLNRNTLRKKIADNKQYIKGK